MPANPNTTRARFMLEIASELVAQPQQGFAQADVELLPQGRGTPTRFLSATTAASLDAVIARQADMAIINPMTTLVLAHRGKGNYSAPQPVRLITVIPSADQYVFAVRPETELNSFEDIARLRKPLKISLRGQPDHSLHPMLDQIAAAAGFSLDDLKSWGGEARREGTVPFPHSPRFQGLVTGEVDALFDEASSTWVGAALDADMKIIGLSEVTMMKLETIGYRRAFVRREQFPKLPADVLTVDFSGWPVYVHAEAADELVTHICESLIARKASIPWDGDGPLPVERMCREAADTPQDVPLHPAAERFWRERGYLS